MTSSSSRMSGLLHTSFQTDPPVVGQGSATDPSDRELGVHSFQVLISGHIIHVQLPNVVDPLHPKIPVYEDADPSACTVSAVHGCRASKTRAGSPSGAFTGSSPNNSSVIFTTFLVSIHHLVGILRSTVRPIRLLKSRNQHHLTICCFLSSKNLHSDRPKTAGQLACLWRTGSFFMFPKKRDWLSDIS